jgi:hypothetical protein
MRRSASRRRPCACLAAWGIVVAGLAACTSWQVRPSPLRDLIVRQHPGRVRLTVVGRDQVTLDEPVVQGDSLVGHVTQFPFFTERAAFALRDIRRIEIREFDAGRTLALGGAVALAAIVAKNVGGGGSGGGTYSPPTTSGGSGGYGGLSLGSCPHVYSWDGHRWRLDSGTFGGAITAGAQRADVDNLGFAVPQGDTLRLRLASEMPETDHVDAVTLLAVDHEPGVTVAPDAVNRLHALGALQSPLVARDYRGRDVLGQVLAEDRSWWESDMTPRDTADLAQVRDGVELSFVRPHSAASATLVLDATNTPAAANLLGVFIMAHGRATQAWYDSLDASPPMAAGLDSVLAREAFLNVWVRTAAGWERQGYLWEAGAEAMKRQVQPLRLDGVAGDTIAVRLESVAGFWRVDGAAIAFGPERPMTAREVRPARAVSHDGRSITHLLAYPDRQELVSQPGEWADLTFLVPPPPDGSVRSYLVRSEGWYRVHVPAEGEPDLALLRRVLAEPYAMSRAAVAKLNAFMLAPGGAR